MDSAVSAWETETASDYNSKGLVEGILQIDEAEGAYTGLRYV